MNKKIILYAIVGIIVLGLVLVTIFPGIVSFKDSPATGGFVDDKCSPTPGYTEEAWREHMSHHPEMYKECLG
ncbi:MAG TPA: hypothetical protein ENH99_02095 [Candidatus Pacearchaeota archaeon]|nr:hypothetical protein [Candidatus Pacearchaeota archaeon]